MKIGQINKLFVARLTDNGYYLANSEQDEVLLPNAYVTDDIEIGNEIEVFIYKDSEDRFVATTLTPHIQFEEFAYLKVVDVNQNGAFVDWGLPKDLMIPFDEQNKKLQVGEWHLVFMLIDEETNRLIGSCKVNEFIFKDVIDLKPADEVDLLLYETSDLGMKAIVNNMYSGLIFNSDIHQILNPGEKLKGYVKQIRQDGKIDISLEPIGYRNVIDKNTDFVLKKIKENKGLFRLTDKSSAVEINSKLGISKKAFKKAIGNLYKQKKIILTDEGIKLVK